MSDEHINQELSLDDIFSRARKESDLKSKKGTFLLNFLTHIQEKTKVSSSAGTSRLMIYSGSSIPESSC